MGLFGGEENGAHLLMMDSPGKWSIRWRKTEQRQEREGWGGRDFPTGSVNTCAMMAKLTTHTGLARRRRRGGSKRKAPTGRQSTKEVSRAPGAGLPLTPKEAGAPPAVVGGVGAEERRSVLQTLDTQADCWQEKGSRN